jgi:hypothetical protein
VNTQIRGLNRRIHGSCQALAEQAKDPKYKKEDAKWDMKCLSTCEGYPIKKKKIFYKGEKREWEEPESLAGQPDEIALILMNTIQCFADERELYLYEYFERFPNDPNPIAFRSIGGRDYFSMQEYIKELVEKGEVDKANKLKEVHKSMQHDEKIDDYLIESYERTFNEITLFGDDEMNQFEYDGG